MMLMTLKKKLFTMHYSKIQCGLRLKVQLELFSSTRFPLNCKALPFSDAGDICLWLSILLTVTSPYAACSIDKNQASPLTWGWICTLFCWFAAPPIHRNTRGVFCSLWISSRILYFFFCFVRLQFYTPFLWRLEIYVYTCIKHGFCGDVLPGTV